MEYRPLRDWVIEFKYNSSRNIDANILSEILI